MTDYAGRTTELLFLQGDTTGARAVTPSLVDGDGRMSIATGIVKLVQVSTSILLNRLGSNIFKDEGTHFMRDALSGRWRTPADVARSFTSARVDLVRQLRARETADTPDDERISLYELQSVSLVDSRASIGVALATVAGTSAKYVIPLQVPLK